VSLSAEDLSAIEFRATRQGVAIRLRCRPGSPTTAIRGVHAGALRLDVAAPPEKGKANKEVVAFLARALGLPRDAIAITAGEASRDKSVELRGVSEDEARARLARAR
jgi:uncharacterized protein (TIGR00251 family)